MAAVAYANKVQLCRVLC